MFKTQKFLSINCKNEIHFIEKKQIFRKFSHGGGPSSTLSKLEQS